LHPLLPGPAELLREILPERGVDMWSKNGVMLPEFVEVRMNIRVRFPGSHFPFSCGAHCVHACIACNARRQRIFHKAGRKCIAKQRRVCVFIGAQSMKNSANTKRRIRSFEAAEDVHAMLDRAQREDQRGRGRAFAALLDNPKRL